MGLTTKDISRISVLYYQKKMPLRKIALVFNLCHVTILDFMEKHQLPRRNRSEIQKGKKLSEKTKNLMRKAHLGKKPANFGKKMSKEFCKKISENNWMRNIKPELHPMWKGGKPNCKICGKKLSSYMSIHCNRCKRLIYVKEKHWNWKNGITTIALQIHNSDKYKSWRLNVYKRDNFRCQHCQKGGILNAHHKIAFSKILSDFKINSFKQALKCNLLWDINNGQTLCVKCHKKIKLKEC